MNLTIRILFIIFLLLFVGHTRISLAPFKFEILYWRTSLGILLLIVGFLLVSYDSESKNYKQGLKDGRDKAIHEMYNQLKIKDHE